MKSRGARAKFYSRLDDLKGQLSRLAYVRWEQVSEKRFDMRQGRTEFEELPGGDMNSLSVMVVRGGTVTFEVGITERNTQSRGNPPARVVLTTAAGQTARVRALEELDRSKRHHSAAPERARLASGPA